MIAGNDIETAAPVRSPNAVALAEPRQERTPVGSASAAKVRSASDRLYLTISLPNGNENESSALLTVVSFSNSDTAGRAAAARRRRSAD